MTQEEKQLLLIDLCARLPYHTIVSTREGDLELVKVDILNGLVYVFSESFLEFDAFEIKPYLRLMSSMTEEEEVLFRCELPAIAKTDAQLVTMRMELFLKGHLDFNHLIEKGLALEALDGMYKIKEKYRTDKS